MLHMSSESSLLLPFLVGISELTTTLNGRSVEIKKKWTKTLSLQDMFRSIIFSCKLNLCQYDNMKLY